MRIITYSDLHLEFSSGMLPPAVNGDVMILAGDIVTLKDCEPLDQILRKWKKPVLYLAKLLGNTRVARYLGQHHADSDWDLRVLIRRPQLGYNCTHYEYRHRLRSCGPRAFWPDA